MGTELHLSFLASYLQILIEISTHVFVIAWQRAVIKEAVVISTSLYVDCLDIYKTLVGVPNQTLAWSGHCFTEFMWLFLAKISQAENKSVMKYHDRAATALSPINTECDLPLAIIHIPCITLLTIGICHQHIFIQMYEYVLYQEKSHRYNRIDFMFLNMRCSTKNNRDYPKFSFLTKFKSRALFGWTAVLNFIKPEIGPKITKFLYRPKKCYLCREVYVNQMWAQLNNSVGCIGFQSLIFFKLFKWHLKL